MKHIPFCLVLLIASVANAQHKNVSLGKLLDDVALNAAAGSRTFYVGPRTMCDSATSATATCTGDQLRGYAALRLELAFTHAANGAITLTCTEGATRATATFRPTTSTEASGTYTLAMSGVVSTASLSTSASWAIVANIRSADVIKCVASHGGTATANDKLTITGWLIAD